MVTIVRDPYDTFVSMFYWLQTRSVADREKEKQRPRDRPKDVLIGKDIDDPAVLEFLSTTFEEYLRRGDDWIHSGRAVVARYEHLHKDPVAELTKVTNQIKPVDEATILQAIETCKAENMRSMSKKMSQHIRSASVGDSQKRLSEAHLEIFRTQYADYVRRLGYEVR
ncbi:MAG: sulfotransferase domain-containing protein [Chloroflexota bacterium]